MITGHTVEYQTFDVQPSVSDILRFDCRFTQANHFTINTHIL